MPLVRRRVERALARGWVSAHQTTREDLVQEIWATLIARTRNLDGVRMGPGDAERFVTVAADRTLISLGRRDRAEKRNARSILPMADLAQIEDPGPDPEQRVRVRQQARSMLRRVHDRLPPRGQAVLRLWLVEELDPPEIAKVMGVRLQVVYNWQHRIRTICRGPP